jgi:hypothetical protein
LGRGSANIVRGIATRPPEKITIFRSSKDDSSCTMRRFLEMNVESYRRKAALKRKRGPAD